MKKIIPLLAITTLLALGACTISVAPQSNATATITPPLPFFSATIPPTFTPRPSSTSLPPTAIPTVAPIGGLITTQINVRSKPDQTSASLGTLKNGDQVQIIGKDVSGAWWQITYSASADGKGWIASAYVNAEGNGATLPVIDPSGAIIPTANPINTIAPTNAPFTSTSNAKTASVQSKINVRSGPGSNYNSLGLLNPGDIVTLTGRNETSAWLQIIYPGGPDDRGWVSAAYVQAPSVEGLPYYNNLGTPIGNIPTLVVNPATPTPTLIPAPQDGDSSAAPAFSLIFSPAGSRLFTFSDAVSSPEGDNEDWLAIKIDGASGQTKTILISIACAGNGSAQAILQKSGSAFANSGAIECGAAGQSFTLNTQEVYLLQIKSAGASSLQFTSYTISIQVQ